MTPLELQSLAETEEGKECLRVKLAELCGWTHDGGGYWIPPGKSKLKGKYYTAKPSDYCDDLNAVHEVEKTLPNDDDPRGYSSQGVGMDMSSRELFRHYLDLICEGNPHVVHATALQRTIALILTMQKPSA